ncbi:hypothetical protein Nepgr_008757 [Nepenthes gracilis]|uniref:glutathione transferase n=1 Tax=Nepenthes gracilis TaxID=150966 RepID=A0AAD3SA10_NEPGR|nr:hypothetical protein Nepgr_008757 [Nepenthes gracilis]
MRIWSQDVYISTPGASRSGVVAPGDLLASPSTSRDQSCPPSLAVKRLSLYTSRPTRIEPSAIPAVARLSSKHASSAMEEKPKLKLYSYWRSSCSWRVRIALNFKGLKYEYKAVNLLKGEQFSPEFTNLNPLGYVPVLVDGDLVVADSFAIIMYLEEKYPQRPLLPNDLQKRAVNYQAANIVSSNIQPLQNLAVLKYIEEKFNPDEKLPWVQCHIQKGFAALEKLLKVHGGKYATGNEVGLADVFLAPQIDAAIKKFSIDMVEFPLLNRLNDAYSELPEFQDAMPKKQPDAPNYAKS